MDTIKIYLDTSNYRNIINNSKNLWKPNNKDNPTYYYVHYNDIYFKYIPDKYYLSMQFSVTKLLYERNTLAFKENDLNKLYYWLNKSAHFLLNGIPDVQYWKIGRIDLAYNYYCACEDDKLEYINTFKKFKYSRYKSEKEYETSVHQHNKSFVYNIYSKSNQDSSADKNILRVEFQYKNPAINKEINKGNLSSKTFGSIFKNLDECNELYRSKLLKLGLQNKFLTKEQMSKFLNKLLTEGKIENCLYQNMYAYFIEESKSISAGTLYKYKKVLSQYGIHHVILDKELTKNIDFMDFSLFKKSQDQTNLYQKETHKTKDSFKVNFTLSLFVVQLYLLLISLFINTLSEFIFLPLSIKTLFIIIKNSLLKNISIKHYFDDS